MKTKFVILVLLAGLLSACGTQSTQAPASSPTQAPASTSTNTAGAPTDAPTTASAATTGISFANDVLPILQSRCVNCHGGNQTQKGLALKSYDSVMAGSENGAVVIPGDANNSLLVQMIQNGKMPKRGPKLTPSQLQVIVDWINQGALNN